MRNMNNFIGSVFVSSQFDYDAARGNILVPDYGKVSWTGTGYL